MNRGTPGSRHVQTTLAGDVHRRLHDLSYDTNRSMADLLSDAVLLLLQQHGRDAHMNTTFEQAATAKATLRAQLGQPTWLRGVGISANPAGPAGTFIVKVNVSDITPEVISQIPNEIDGVRVLLEAVGDIKAL